MNIKRGASTISTELVRKLFDYSPETGLFTWKARRQGIRAGTVAGGMGGDGYWNIQIGGKKYKAHRLAFIWMTGEWPTAHVDHINLCRDDNRWANLRQCSNAQNHANTKKPSTNTSGFKGVTFHKGTGKWQASIKVNDRFLYLGLFEHPDAAHKAYCRAALEHHGEFARTA